LPCFSAVLLGLDSCSALVCGLITHVFAFPSWKSPVKSMKMLNPGQQPLLCWVPSLNTGKLHGCAQCCAPPRTLEATACRCNEQLCSFRPDNCISQGGTRSTLPYNTAHSARVGFNFYLNSSPSCLRIANAFAHHTTEIGIIYARGGLDVEVEDILLSDNRHALIRLFRHHSQPTRICCNACLKHARKSALVTDWELLQYL
jgi:hypothetical protein